MAYKIVSWAPTGFANEVGAESFDEAVRKARELRKQLDGKVGSWVDLVDAADGVALFQWFHHVERGWSQPSSDDVRARKFAPWQPR